MPNVPEQIKALRVKSNQTHLQGFFYADVSSLLHWFLTAQTYIAFWCYHYLGIGRDRSSG